MKYFKRLVFIALFAFSALLLVACGGIGASDNGVYVFEPTSEEILEMVEKETGTNSAANLFVDQLKIKLVLEIKDNTGTISTSVSIFGNDKEKKEDSTSKSSIVNDNGKYVYKADKEQIEGILKEQGATDAELNQLSDQVTLTMTIEIKDTKAKMIIEMKALGESKEKTIDLKADQKGKTLESAEGGKDKVKYIIDGDVLTLDLSKFDAEDSETFAFFKDAKFKRQK